MPSFSKALALLSVLAFNLAYVHGFECHNDSECRTGQYCASISNTYAECRSFARLNEECEDELDVDGVMDFCNPKVHQCFKPKVCIDHETVGRCQPLSKKFDLGDCCKDDSDCESNYCGSKTTLAGEEISVCQVLQVEALEIPGCPDGEYLTKNQWGDYICKPFASLGEQCEFETEPGTEKICDPSIHVCHKPEGCFFPQAGGTCQPIGKKYGLGDCCQVDDDCTHRNCDLGETELGQKLVCQKSN